MKKVLIAGGLCGTTMLVAAEKIEARCEAAGVTVAVTIQNLWETSYVRPGYDLMIEMFPYFEDMQCPVISGKPFINHVGEKELLGSIAGLLCMEASA